MSPPELLTRMSESSPAGAQAPGGRAGAGRRRHPGRHHNAAIRRAAELAAAVRLPAGLVALVLLSGAGPARAQSPIGPLPAPSPQVETTATQAPTTSSSSGALSTGSQVLIFVGAGAVLGLIAFVIVRDARSHAPARGHAGGETERKTTAPRAVRVSRGRARAKQARRARRRNR